MDLKDKIALCEQCSLYKDMSISPIVPEWRGSPNNMWILNSMPNLHNDLEQTPLTGINRTLLLKVFKENDLSNWYVTFSVKCCKSTKSYSKKEKDACLQWINYEKAKLRPKYVIVCGSMIPNIGGTHYLPALHNVLNNKDLTQDMIKIINEITNDKLS